MNTKQKGSIGEQKVILDLLEKGYRVLTPINEDSPYDILVDTKNTFVKIQVKYRTDLSVPKDRVHSDTNGIHTKPYTQEEVDVFAVVNDNHVLYVPYSLRGISLKEKVTSSWSYIVDDFKLFPCKDKYYRKILLSDGLVISELEKKQIMLDYDKTISVKENAIKAQIPYHTYRKWVYPTKHE